MRSISSLLVTRLMLSFSLRGGKWFNLDACFGRSRGCGGNGAKAHGKTLPIGEPRQHGGRRGAGEVRRAGSDASERGPGMSEERGRASCSVVVLHQPADLAA